MNSWRDIGTAPKDGTEIITVVAGFKATVGWYDGKKWCNYHSLINELSVKTKREHLIIDDLDYAVNESRNDIVEYLKSKKGKKQ